MAQNFPRLFTLQQFADRHPAFTASSLRWLRFRSEPVRRTRRGSGGDSVVEELKPNGFARAFVRVGGRLFVDEDSFFKVVAEQNGVELPPTRAEYGE